MEDDPLSFVPEQYRHLVKGPVKRIYPGDTDWICGEHFGKHGCMEMHNSTGDSTHKCCCEFEWND